MCINSDDGYSAMKTVSRMVSLWCSASRSYRKKYGHAQCQALRLDAKRVEGVGNGEGVFPSPADYGGLRSVVRFSSGVQVEPQPKWNFVNLNAKEAIWWHTVNVSSAVPTRPWKYGHSVPMAK